MRGRASQRDTARAVVLSAVARNKSSISEFTFRKQKFSLFQFARTAHKVQPCAQLARLPLTTFVRFGQTGNRWLPITLRANSPVGGVRSLLSISATLRGALELAREVRECFAALEVASGLRLAHVRQAATAAGQISGESDQRQNHPAQRFLTKHPLVQRRLILFLLAAKHWTCGQKPRWATRANSSRSFPRLSLSACARPRSVRSESSAPLNKQANGRRRCR